MSRGNVCPPLVAVFENRLAMRVIRGSILTRQNVANPKVARTTAREIGKMHRNAALLASEKSESFSAMASKIISLIPDEYSKASVRKRQTELGMPGKAVLIAELAETAKLFAAQTTPLVLSHNDLALNNFLYESDEDKIHIIDYEYIAPNPAAFDIATHFNGYAGSKNVRNIWLTTWLIYYSRSTTTTFLTTSTSNGGSHNTCPPTPIEPPYRMKRLSSFTAQSA